MNRTKYVATIKYQMNENNYDFKYVNDTQKVQTFTDMFNLDNNIFSIDYSKEYIKEQLMLQATNGDYSSVRNVEYNIYEVGALIEINEITIKSLKKLIKDHENVIVKEAFTGQILSLLEKNSKLKKFLKS